MVGLPGEYICVRRGFSPMPKVFPFSLAVAVRIIQIFYSGISQALEVAIVLPTIHVARMASCNQKSRLWIKLVVTMGTDHAVPKIGVISLGMTVQGISAHHACEISLKISFCLFVRARRPSKMNELRPLAYQIHSCRLLAKQSVQCRSLANVCAGCGVFNAERLPPGT
jgi:hypothetical protein